MLELTRELRSPPSRRRACALCSTRCCARPGRGRRLAAAETKLARLFAERTADEGAVRAAVKEAEAARREVRLVHLLAHLQTHDVLTEAQRQKYHELRWGQATAR